MERCSEFGIDPKTDEGVKALKHIVECVFNSGPTEENYREAVDYCFNKKIQE